MSKIVFNFKKLRHIFIQAEEIFLGLLLLILIVLSCFLILLRLSRYGGLIWADQLLRYLVLWSGFLGAAMATSRGKHISLDIIGTLMPPGLKVWTFLLNHLFSTIVSTLLTWASFLFIISEKEYGVAGLLGFPSYQWNLIFPIAFSLITLRYFLKTITTMRLLIAGKSLPESPSL